MKKFLYSIACIVLIIIFLIQGKLILCAEREKEKLTSTLINESSYKTMGKNVEESIKINRLMELLYSKNRQYEVNNLSFKEEGQILEVEVNYSGTIDHMREEFKVLMSSAGFQKIESYQEDDKGRKKLCLSFVFEK